jgi:hypothetical protein
MIYDFRLTKSEILNQMDNLFVFNAFAPLRLCEKIGSQRRKDAKLSFY